MNKVCNVLQKIIKNGVTETEWDGVEWVNLVKDKGPVAYYSDDRKKMSVLLKGSVSLPLVC
jgi:hypothetical protein